MARIVDCVFNTHLGQGHRGLALTLQSLRDRGDDVSLADELAEGQCVIFINRKQNAFKMLAGGESFLCHYKHPHGQLSLDVIRAIPSLLSPGSHASTLKNIREYIDAGLNGELDLDE
jgi:hypothetical protein